MDKPDNAKDVRKGASRLRRVWIIAGSAVAFLAALYFILTGSAFLKAVVLPRLGRGINANVTADTISLSPFSRLVLRGLKVQTTGTEPLLQAEEVQVRYHLWALLKGRIDVPEITLVAPHLSIVQDANGTSNLDPVRKSFEGPKSGKSQGPPALALGHVAIDRGTIRWTQNAHDGSRQSAELSDMKVVIDQLQNGQSGKATLALGIRCELNPAPSIGAATNNVLRAQVSGDWTFKLAPDLLPQTISGATRCQVAEATGAWRDVAALTGILECELTPSAIEKFTLRFEREGKALGQIRASGPVDLAKIEGRVKVEILSIDRQILNVFGATRGWDFGATTLNSSNLVDVAQQGKLIAAGGRIAGSQVSVSQKGTVTPGIDFGLNYQFTLNLAQQNFLCQSLALSAKQGSNDVLQANLERAMNFAWGAAERGYKNSAVRFSATNLNLADWRFLLGDSVSAGLVSFQGGIVSTNDGQQLTADLGAQVVGFSGKWNTNVISLSEFQCRIKGDLSGYERINLQSLEFKGSDGNRSWLSGSASASGDLSGGGFRVRANLDVSLADLLGKYPVPLATATAGNLTINGLLTQKGNRRSLIGMLALHDFTGRYADYQFQNYQANLDYDCQLEKDEIQINRANLTLGQGFASGGAGNITGVYDLNKQTARLRLTNLNLNERAIGPFLAPGLAPRGLTSVGLTANGDATFDRSGQSTLKADLTIANLLLSDPAKQSPSTPFNAQFHIDGSLEQARQLRLNQLVMSFLDGKDSGGQVQLGGAFDLGGSTGDFNFKISDLNQTALRPWVNGLLAPKSLVSASLNGSGSGAYDPHKDSSVKATLSLTNLVVNDPSVKLAGKPKPLEARLELDGSLRAGQADIRLLALALPPTARATNRVEMQGRLDFSPTNALAGKLDLQSESIDLTPLLDMLGGKKSTNATPAAKAAAPTTATQAEPAATSLPVGKLDVNLKIGSCYLGDLSITNWQTGASLDKGSIKLNPSQLTVNGGPIQAQGQLNLGVPGYTYEVKLQADKVPLGPFVDTFSPTLKGQYQGNLAAQADLKGAGLTGTGLQKNLAGQLSVSCTNANVALFSPSAKTLLTPVALLLQMQELLDSPVDAVSARLQVGQGTVQVQQFTAFSQAYQADSQGTIALAPQLTNSTLNLPVTLALRRSLAEKANMVTANSPTGTVFVTLPSFVKITGTLGSPHTDTDKTALAQIGLRLLEGIPSVGGGKAGNVLGGVENLLSGDKSALTNQLQNLIPGLKRSTNVNVLAPFSGALGGTNQSTLSNLIPGALFKTNAPPAASTNQPTATNSVDLLRKLLNRW